MWKAAGRFEGGVPRDGRPTARGLEARLRGEYLIKNPTWDAEDAPWKAGHILDIMNEKLQKGAYNS